MKKLLNHFNKKSLEALILLIPLIFISYYTITPSYAQITYLKVEASTTLLKAGFINNVTLTIFNDFETIYELYASLSFQTFNAPTVLGASSWKLGKLMKGNQAEIKVAIFAPDSIAGNAYTANLVLTYKRLGYISSYTEVHTLGFYVKGWIEITLYDLMVDPNPAYPGNTISFTASILNKGNIPASFTNVSLLKNDVLILTFESFNYLGEIDSASSTPFTLEAIVNPEAYEGNYTATIIVSYEDKEHNIHTINYQIPFSVIKPSETQSSTKNASKYVLTYLLQHWFPIFLLITFIVLIVSYIVFKFKSKTKSL
ncbi:MAG: hypothetical protein QXL69_03815 [Candidatus Bathyarchaeia archaeon]|nr:hypothetical protein [Candidatus Bathyarchaeota archaeon]